MEHNESDMPILRIVTTPRVAVALLTCTVGAYSIGTIEATLSQFLEMQLGLSVRAIVVDQCPAIIHVQDHVKS